MDRSPCRLSAHRTLEQTGQFRLARDQSDRFVEPSPTQRLHDHVGELRLNSYSATSMTNGPVLRLRGLADALLWKLPANFIAVPVVVKTNMTRRAVSGQQTAAMFAPAREWC
jgi:hypothetical protein